MTSNSTQLHVPTLNSLFEHMTAMTNLVFWIRTLNYQTQLYVSPNYQQVWGIPCDSLYQNPASWIETLTADDRYRLEQQFLQRAQAVSDRQQSSIQDTLLFRVHRPQSTNTLIHIRDKAFALTDSNQKPIAIAGIGMKLEPDHWERMIAGNDEIATNAGDLEKSLIQLINTSLQLLPKPLSSIIATPQKSNGKAEVRFTNQSYYISQREAQCLYYSVKGYSAKQIAKLFSISPRTVETHLEHLKNKFGCSNKLQLIGNSDISLLNY